MIRKYALWLGLVPFALGATFFAACGDDDDGGSDRPGAGSGSEEDFVSDLCKIGAQFAKDIDEAEAPTDPEDLDSLTEPFEKFAEDFGDLNPPSDLEDWHSEASKSLDDLVKKLKDGDFEALAEADEPFPDLPEDARERYEKLAEDDEDCQEAEGLFSE